MADANYTAAAAFLIPHHIDAASFFGNTFGFLAVLVAANSFNLLNGTHWSAWINAEHNPKDSPQHRNRLRALFYVTYCILQLLLAVYYRFVIVNDNLSLSIVLFLGAGLIAPAIIDAFPTSHSFHLAFRGNQDGV